jgi:hypothetical protein
MGILRWAGDALRGYEGKWNEAVTAGLRPVDRLIASDEDRAKALAPVFADAYAADGGFGRTVQEHMAVLSPDGRMAEKVGKDGDAYIERKMAEKGDSPRGVVEQLALTGLIPKYATDAGRKAYDEKYGPSLPISQPGLIAHSALANPVMAYGMPAAGIGLAAWGIHDVLAAQQRAEKEGQLPVQGGVQ